MEELIGILEGWLNRLVESVETLDQKITDVTKLTAEGFAEADLVRTIGTEAITAADRQLEGMVDFDE
ncbi:unnamed protein product [Linum trigynum]|uniref:Uncharacterized protein n=1 Tax=Linum trigynum TaxID=586398 RepID=A0AAV2GA24_9ROSI